MIARDYFELFRFLMEKDCLIKGMGLHERSGSEKREIAPWVKKKGVVQFFIRDK